MNEKIVGVIGLGSVGWATIHSLHPMYGYCGYDIADSYDFSKILSSSIIFICVQTPLSSENRLDCSAVEDVLVQLNKENYKNCVVIKSTLSVGFMDKVAAKFPSLHLVYMPEFLRECSSFTWCKDPDRLVISGSDEDITETLSYFTWVPEDIPRLKMSWKSAEIGKLAHNAFIATKVSFTNEIQALSLAHHADPNDVMHIIWADRRVHSSEHLTPYLGKYSGKCVPKDTLELINCGGNHPLLTTVDAVNNALPDVSSSSEEIEIVTIIPTKNRPEYLERALLSVSKQRKKPATVYIVYDFDEMHTKEIENIVKRFSSDISIKVIQNTHMMNLSGAVNTGLSQALLDYPDMDNTYVSILDDDDWWDISYLQNSAKFATETKADWIITGLIRHDIQNPDGYPQSIPQHIDIDDFYVGNPNIQGSNLFVKLSKILGIGGFDENLTSTTDRDVCVRLCKSNTSYAVLNNHLVHHDAIDDHKRLSQPGNDKKIKGLQIFYKKYSHDMSDKQKEAFKKRAKSLFAAEIGDIHE